MVRGETTSKERQRIAEKLLKMPYKEMGKELERLHSDLTMNEWTDMYSRMVDYGKKNKLGVNYPKSEKNPGGYDYSDPEAESEPSLQQEIRYKTPDDLNIPSMSDEELSQSIDGIERGQSELTSAEKPIALEWLKDEMKKRKGDKLDYEVVNDKAVDAIKDNFTPPGAKIGVDNEYIEYSEKPKALTKDHIEKYGEEMLKKLGASDEQIAEAKKDIDTNNNGKIEVDEMADFQKSLDDYASKNKKSRDDIPVTTRR